jgi:hypothetical protein
MSVLRISEHVQSPGFRFVKDGPNSGGWFRESVLSPALKAAINQGSELTVELDGVAGYGSSFLEEAFGGLIRERHFTRDQVDRHLKIVARSSLFEPYRDLALRFIGNAVPIRESAMA